MERLTNRAEVDNIPGIWVKEGFAYDGLKTFFSRHDEGFSAINKCAEYENLEEQGLLLRLPCRAGTTVYHIVKGRILETEADSFFLALSVVEGRFGKSVFLTLEEAERKLLEERNVN